MTSSEQAGLAIGLIALGILVSYGIYWVYRRYNPTSGSGAGMGLLKSQPKWLKDPIRAQNNNNPSSRYFGSGNNKSPWLNYKLFIVLTTYLFSIGKTFIEHIFICHFSPGHKLNNLNLLGS